MDDGPVAVVTGASSGIGQATARQLAAAGFRVFGASRSTPARDGSAIEHVVIDVRDDASVRDGIAGIMEAAGRIDVLVNSAGYLCAGAVEEVPITDARAQFETNYFGVVRMTAAVLPHMREQRAGHIITVSSLAGLAPVPFWGNYNASKFAVEGLMETLRQEVRPFGICIAMVEPSAIRTPFFARPAAAGIDAYAGPRERVFAVIAAYERNAPEPETVAGRIVSIAGHPHPPLRNKITKEAVLVPLLKRLLPEGAFEAWLRRNFKLQASDTARPTGKAAHRTTPP